MSRTAHLAYIGIFTGIILTVLILLVNRGLSYYRVSIEERFYHPDNSMLKPSGEVGHSLGITGSFCILIGVGTYMARKRYRIFSRIGLLKYWLEFHIFMCILGTILVIFHTSFKVGGLAAISFWSMITVFASGFAGRIIYLQIPRTMEGRALDLKEAREMRNEIMAKIRDSAGLDEDNFKLINYSVENRLSLSPGMGFPGFLRRYLEDKKSVAEIREILKRFKMPKPEFSRIIALVKSDIRLGRAIERLEKLKNLFRYWHVFHLPFAILMLLFMIMHVTVTVALGYRWIF